MKGQYIRSRILSGILSAAMLITMAPQTALTGFAAQDALVEDADVLFAEEENDGEAAADEFVQEGFAADDASLEAFISEDDAPARLGAGVSAPSAEQKVEAAPLNKKADVNPFTSYSVSQSGTASPVTVTIKAEALEKSAAQVGDGEKYWVGIALPQYAEETGWMASYYTGQKKDGAITKKSETALTTGEGYKSGVTIGGASYDAFYYDAYANMDKEAYLVAEYTLGEEYADFDRTVAYRIVISSSEVKLNNGLPTAEDLTKVTGDYAIQAAAVGEDSKKNYTSAPATGTITDKENYSFTVPFQATTVKQYKIAEDTNGRAGNGYWIGVQIPQLELDSNKYTVTYATNNTGKAPETISDEKLSGVVETTEKVDDKDVKTTRAQIAWFDAETVKKAGGAAYIYAKYAVKESNPEESVVVTIKVDLSKVEIDNGLPGVPALTSASDKEKTGEITASTTRADDADYYAASVKTITLARSEDVPGVTRSENPAPGYYVGVAVPIPSAEDYTALNATSYLVTANESELKSSDNYKAETIAAGGFVAETLKDKDDKATHDVLYFNVKGLVTNGKLKDEEKVFYVSVRYAAEGDGAATETYTFAVNVKDVAVDLGLPADADVTGGTSATTGVVIAALSDHQADEKDNIEPVAAKGYTIAKTAISASEADETLIDGTKIAFTAKDLKKFKPVKKENDNGYYVGLEFTKQDDVTTTYAIGADKDIAGDAYKAIDEVSTTGVVTEKVDAVAADAEKKTPAVPEKHRIFIDTKALAGTETPQYLYVKFVNDDKDEKIVKFLLDFEKVSLSTGLPEVKIPVTVPETSEKYGKVGTVTAYDKNNNAIAATDTTTPASWYQVPVTAAALASQTTPGAKDSDTAAYYVGIAIPAVNDVKETAYKAGEKEDALSTVPDTVKQETIPATVTDEAPKTYDVFYIPADKYAGTDTPYYISATYTTARGDEKIYLYAVDFSGVTLSGLPDPTKIQLQTAKLTKNESEDTSDYKNLDTKGSAVTGYEAAPEITGVEYTNAGGEYGYWISVAVPQQTVEGTAYYLGTDEPADYKGATAEGTYVKGTRTTGEGDSAVTYDLFYIDVKDLIDKKDPVEYLSVKYTSADEKSEALTWTLDLSAVVGALVRGEAQAPQKLIAAPTIEAGKDDESGVYTDTKKYTKNEDPKVEAVKDAAGVYEVTAKTTGLQRFTKWLETGEADEKPGYWAGVGIPQIEGYTTTYQQSNGKVDDPAPTTGTSKPAFATYQKTKDATEKYDLFYFDVTAEGYDTETTDGKTYGYIYAKYVPNGEGKDTDASVIYTYRVDLTTVIDNLAVWPDDKVLEGIEAAPLKDDEEGSTLTQKDLVGDPYTAVAKKDGAPAGGVQTVNVTLTATELAQHYRNAGSAKGIGYWTGIALPESLKDAAESVKYYVGNSLNGAEYAEVDDTKNEEVTIEDKKYNVFLFDATDYAGTIKPYYVSVELENGTEKNYINYRINAQAVTLKAPVYDVTIEDKGTTAGQILFEAKEDAEAQEITLTATATSGEGEEKKNVSKETVVWTVDDGGAEIAKFASADNVYTASVSGRTDANGTAVAKLQLKGAKAPGVVTVTATVGGKSRGSYVIELYTKAEVTEALELQLPGQSVAALTPTFVLADDSQYATKWTSSDEKAATVDESGIVTALADTGEVTFTHAIVDPNKKNAVVDSKGKVSGETGYVDKNALKSGADAYKAKITTKLTEIWIEPADPNAVFYANNAAVNNALVIKTSPATYDVSKIEEVKFASSNTKVVAADGFAKGNAKNLISVTPLAKGTTVLTVTVGDLKANYVVSVRPKAKEVTVTTKAGEEEANLKVGNTLNLNAVVDNGGDNDVDGTVTWSVASGSEAFASVDRTTGMVTGKKAGDATIQAAVPDGTTAAFTVKVYEELTAITLNTNALNLAKDSSVELEAILTPDLETEDDTTIVNLSWTTKDTDGAIITLGNPDSDTAAHSKKKVTAKAAGKTTVTVTDAVSGKSATANIEVGGTATPLTSLTATNPEVSIMAGKTAALTYTAAPKNYTDTILKWEVADSSIATVDSTGVVTAKKEGTTTVTLQAYKTDGTTKFNPEIKATYSITVTPIPNPETITITPGSLTLKAPIGSTAGESAKIIATVQPTTSGKTAKDITWLSLDTKVATVERTSTGAVVRAVSEGSTTIYATVEGLPGDNQPKISVTVRSDVSMADQLTGRYVEDGVWIGEVEDYVYTGAAFKPEPNVYYGSTLLTSGTDYTLSWKNNTNVAKSKNQPTVIATMKGNYAGKIEQTFVIEPRDISEVTINDVSAMAKSKTAKGGATTFTEQLLKPVLTYGGKTLKLGTDYALYYMNDGENAYAAPGEYKIDIKGSGNFTGTDKAMEILIENTKTEPAINISKATITFTDGLDDLNKKTAFYTGGALTPGVTVEINNVARELTEDRDYALTYTNNTALGTATVTVTGIGGYYKLYGQKKVTFKIVANTIDLAKYDDKDKRGLLEVSVDGQDAVTLVSGKGNANAGEVEYLKGGTKPESVVVTLGDDELVAGKDYTWTNKVKLDAKNGTGTGTITINGKGSFYKGKATVDYTVAKKDISGLTFAVDDFIYAAKAGAYEKNKITIYDVDGKALKVKTDYEAPVFTVDSGSTTPVSGDVVTATFTGTGLYKGTASVDFRIVDKDQKITSAKWAFIDDDVEVASNKFYVKYAGSAVTLDDGQVVLKITKKVGKTSNIVTLTENDDFEVVGYLNNNKVGTATVIVRGINDYAGLKNVTFKITK